MKPIIFTLFLFFLSIIMIDGCAQWGGDNPLGITGGSNNGYGKNNDLNLPDGSDQIDPDLVGVWSMYDYPYLLVYTFNADGSCKIEEYYYDSLDDSYEGTWSVSGNILTLSSNEGSEIMIYEINGNQLTLTEGDYVLVLHRDQIV
jgi:hypothetical protein